MSNANTPGSTEVSPRRRRFIYVMVFLFSVVLGVLGTLLLLNIQDRRREAEQHFFQVVKLDESIIDPAVWGRNFPRQYDSYLRTVDTPRVRQSGGEAINKLEEYPLLKGIFAGYPFSIDFREARGHAYMLVDQDKTPRIKVGNPTGACLHCHSAVLPAYREAGKEIVAKEEAKKTTGKGMPSRELMKGFEELCGMDLGDARQKVDHPVTCHDCHDPETAQLRVTRPAFFIGIDALAKSDDDLPHLPSLMRWRERNRGKIEAWRKTEDARPGTEVVLDPDVPVYDPNKEASRQEMRSFVCGQCHVEYYFTPKSKLVTYPWAKGLKVEDMFEYYEEKQFHDWVHTESGAKVLKAQHPEFEMWSQGTHARAGVSCADCHMPYKREGAIKVSDHWVRSPMLNMGRACQTCHRQDAEELQGRVTTIQARTKGLLKRSQQAVTDLIDAVREAKDAGAAQKRIEAARKKQRKAQFYMDMILSENSLGFHAAQESARILAEAIDEARQGQLLLPRK